MRKPYRLHRLHPVPRNVLNAHESRVRELLLRAGHSNMRAKHAFGLERQAHYARKVEYARSALREDPEGLVLQVTSIAPWSRDRSRLLVAVRLVGEPHIGVHLPCRSDDTLLRLLPQRRGGAA